MTTLDYKDRTHKENENDTLINITHKITSDKEAIQYNNRKLGNTYLFYFKNGFPLIVIGPHCN